METPKDPGANDSANTQHKRGIAQHQKIAEIMTQEVVTITPENTLYEAARIMGEKHIGSLIVMKYETPVGIITERDLLREVVAREIDLEKGKMSSYMKSDMLFCLGFC